MALIEVNVDEEKRRPLLTEMAGKTIKAIIEEAPGKGMKREAVRERAESVLRSLLSEKGYFLTRREREEVISEVVNEILGFGPIDPVLRDPGVSEIMVNGPHMVYVERSGRLEKTNIRFRDDDHVRHVIEKILAPTGRRIDESSPMVDARLPDGSRVNAIIPPLALNGPTLTIRKFARDPLRVENLVEKGTLSPNMALFLKACVRERMNIMICGGTGSGKTTTLNVLSSMIPEGERIVTIEDAAELRLLQEHVVTLEARPANIEGKGRIGIRELVINALRMRPDRIIVGEVRGGEALDMLQAMNTGHDGSMTTGHANSPRDMLSRLETMVLMAGMELPVRAIREQIASALDLIVYQSRMRDGSRKITRITEVLGMEGDTIVLQDIFTYEGGKHRPTGVVPTFADQVRGSGELPLDLFRAS